jgi:hypothetical protein
MYTPRKRICIAHADDAHGSTTKDVYGRTLPPDDFSGGFREGGSPKWDLINIA